MGKVGDEKSNRGKPRGKGTGTWAQFVQVRNSPTLEDSIQRIQEIIPGITKSRIVEDAIFLFAEFAKADAEGAKVVFEHADGSAERVMVIGARGHSK